MAYIPDQWVMKRLPIAQSAQQILFYYCARADQDSGETSVSPEKTSQDLGVRKDHVNEHDRKLVREGFIRIAIDEFGGRIVRLLSPWQSRTERSGNGAQRAERKTTSQDLGEPKQVIPQNLGSPLNSSPRFGEFPQDLGESTQTLGNFTQDLGKTTQDLGAHIRNNQPMNQPIEPEREVDSPAVTAIDDLANTLCALYRIPDTAGWRLKDKFQALAVELHGLGASPCEVEAFYSARKKKPGVDFFTSDYVTWRASQNGNGAAPTNGATHSNGAGDDWAHREIAATFEDLPAQWRHMGLGATEQQKANVLANYNRRVRQARGMEAEH